MARRKTKGRKTTRRSGSPRGRRALLAVLGFVFLVLLVSGVQYYSSPLEGASIRQIATEEAPRLVEDTWKQVSGEDRDSQWIVAHVREVSAPDLIKVEYGKRLETVRLMNLSQAGELSAGGRIDLQVMESARSYTKAALSNRQVRLECSASRATDRLGRRLAYVFVEDQLFNAELVREGFARYQRKSDEPDWYRADFKAAEDAAQDRLLGLWGSKERHQLSADAAGAKAHR